MARFLLPMFVMMTTACGDTPDASAQSFDAQRATMVERQQSH